MTTARRPAAGHHLFWSTGKGKLLHYRVRGRNGQVPATREVSVWSLRKRFPLFVQWLLLARSMRTGTPHPRASKLAIAALDAIDEDRRGETEAKLPLESRRSLFGMLMLGPQRAIARMAERLQTVGSALTPNYRKMLSVLSPAFRESADLTFLTCRPNVYLWLPPGSEDETRVLVCFCTSSNSLNAPLPVAHAALAARGVPICYVFNRKGRFAHKGLPGMDADLSARAIGHLLDRLGLPERYGLGTSLGGYTACRYATGLGLRRLLNFSGWPDKGSESYTDLECMNKALGTFPLDGILTVLSSTDANDKSIADSYDKGGFVTQRVLLDTPTHGSLLGAIIEDRLDGLLDWLLEGRALKA
jgi:hypothetical protein